MTSADPGSRPVLSDGLVTLRPLRRTDVDDITTACHDPQITRWTAVPSPYTRADAEAFVDQHSTDEAWGTEPTWAITVVPDDRWSGSITLRLDGSAGADVGYLVAPWARGSGHAARALRLACAWGFSTLGLQVVTWHAYVGNESSLHSARKVGFQIPPHIFRAYGSQRGHRRDSWVGTLTPEDLGAAARLGEVRRDYLGPDLTRRERDVLTHLARGEANRTIASELGISENTVKNHVRNILEKLQASSRSEAVVSALRLGLVSLPG